MAGTASIQNLIISALVFINEILVPFILAIAFLVFIWNITKYFIVKGASEADHEKAKRVALYGIATFVVIISLWGIVNLLVDGFGLTNTTPITPDYILHNS